MPREFSRRLRDRFHNTAPQDAHISASTAPAARKLPRDGPGHGGRRKLEGAYRGIDAQHGKQVVRLLYGGH